MSINYVRKTVHAAGNGENCSVYSSTATTVFSIQVYYTNQRLHWDDGFHYICKPVTDFDLDNKMNIKSFNGVTYYLDGNTTANGNVLNVSQLSIGQHTITAKKSYDNGEDITEKTFNVYERPAFNSLPMTFGGCPNGNAALALTGITGGGTYSYQWQETLKNSNEWRDCREGYGGAYSGVKSPNFSISIPNDYSNINERRYKVIVRNQCAIASASSESTLRVLEGPSIGTHPSAVTACLGTSATFQVGAEITSGGDEQKTIYYQWQHKPPGDGGGYTDVQGAGNTASLSFTLSAIPVDAYAYNGYKFRCVLRDICAENNKQNLTHSNRKVSNEASLTVVVIAIDPARAPDKTINLCVGGAPFDLYSVLTPISERTGQWNTVGDNDNHTNALLRTSTAATYTASASNVTGTAPHQVEYRVTNSCSLLERLNIFVNPIPSAPTAADVRICGQGRLSATATSPNSVASVFRWYTNERDQTSVITGESCTVDITTNTYRYVEVTTDKGCTSSRTRVSYLYYAKKRVPFTSKTLCSTQAPYDMESGLTDEILRKLNNTVVDNMGSSVIVKGVFSWADGTNTSHIGNIFNPANLARNEPYTITYTSTDVARLPTSCYQDTTKFKITVIGNAGRNGITIDPVQAPDKTINLCVGDAPFDLYSVITPKTGQWFSSNSGTVDFDNSALNKTSNAAVYTALSNNVTTTEPVQVEYRVMANGCTVSDKLKIFIKRNGSVPVMSGIPDNICPGQKFTVTSTIQDSGDTERYGFEYSDPNGDPNAYVSLSNNNPFEYSVERDYQIAVVSIDNTYRCKSAVVKNWIRTPFGSGRINANSQVINVGQAVTYTFNGLNNSAFVWDFGDGEKGNLQNPIKYYYKPGNFVAKLKVTASLGCSEDFELPITVTGAEPQVVTALPEAMPSIYTNPVQSLLYIKGGGKIELFNALGQAQPFALHENGIDMSHLASGVYVLVVEKNHYRVIKK